MIKYNLNIKEKVTKNNELKKSLKIKNLQRNQKNVLILWKEII